MSNADPNGPDIPPPPPPADRTEISTPAGATPSKLHPPSYAPIPVITDPATGQEGDRDEWSGKYIGPYLIKRRLSRGGMGEVLLGRDEALRRDVAVKVMEKKLITDGDAVKRFEREARACASVQHRHIASIYLVGLTEDGLPFLGMEYIDGGSLMHAIRNKVPLTFSQIARIMEEVAAALQAAHKQNVVHRDIKPANIMLTKAGEAKLVDFGLAKIFFEDSYVTQEGMVLGTPSYMAPEQGRGRPVDHRADIYSLGATFYHLIVGRAPFTADSPVQIMMKHVTAPLVPMRTLNPSVPIEFDEIIGRCMRKDVDERYQDYEPLLVDIKRVRLQSTAREQGPIVNADASAARGSSGSMSLPPPPGVANAGAIPLTPRASSFSPNYDALPIENARGFWTPVTITIAFVIIMGIVAGIISASMSASDKSDQQDGTDEVEKVVPRPAFALLLEKAAEKSRGKRDSAVEQAYQSYRRTTDILKSLQEGVANFEIEKQNLPASLKDIISEDQVRINFEVGDDGLPLDGWGVPLSYNRAQREIRSAGLDGSFFNADDLSITLDGNTTVPNDYEKLKGSPR